MPQRRPLYICVDGVEPNNIPQSDPESVKLLWRNVPSSSGVARVVPIKTTLTRVSDLMSSDATETSFIPLGSCRRAQQSPVIRFRIGEVVVEESAIEFGDRQHHISKKKRHTPGRTPCSLCVRRSRRIERKLAVWVCGLLLGACGQGSMPPRRTRRNPGLRRYPMQKGSPDAKRFSGRNPIG